MSVGIRNNRRSAPIHFAPDWGSENWRLWELLSAANAGMLLESTEEMLAEAIGTGEHDSSRLAFSLSMLLDVLKAGANAWVRDSRLFVQWPDWNSSEGRDYAHAAMNAARDMRPLTAKELERVRPMFAPDLEGVELATVLREATFRMETTHQFHPTGVPYQEAFNASLRHWSMPYRGRTGRMKRFVLTARHPLLGDHPVVAGIIELGDEAPFCQWRDDLLGLNLRSFLHWISVGSREQVKEVVGRFRSIRRLLRATSDGLDLSKAHAEKVVAMAAELEAAAHGRSTVRDDQRDLLKNRKRLAYGLRLAKGEAALLAYLRNGDLAEHSHWLYEGVRGIHDLLIPRVHLEATVCGAVPPFSTGLGGKLVVSFLSHPLIIDATMGSESELLNWSFNYPKLSKILPSSGMLCLTTKGLYANHAAIYTRSEMPGTHNPIRFRHLANTDGVTTTLISDRTTRLAKSVLETPSGISNRVSSVYGSGGAKRHRFIEAATISVGLPARIGFAGIQRPVYGALFVENAPSVCWLNAEPTWTVARSMPPDDFCETASDLWRTRWLERASGRVMEYAIIPTLPSLLSTPR